MISGTKLVHMEFLLAFCFSTAAMVNMVSAHGFSSAPRARGAYYTQRPVGNLCSENDLGGRFDYCPHCRNAGGVNVLRAVDGNVDANGMWMPYDPLRGKFRNGATLCGDPVGQNDHSASGMFRAPDFKPFAAEYKPGSIAHFEYDLTTPHGGYLEFYLCDVGDDDIERSQFTSGQCVMLERAPTDECESGNDSQCGPIDPNFNGRFYLPCRVSSSLDQDQIVGGSNGKMSYKIPNKTIRKGVIQIYWLTGNSCLPDGMKEYFTSGTWKQVESSQCEGDGGTKGGFRRDHTGTCTTQQGKFPEEFWNCADVRVVPDAPEIKSYSSDYSQQTGGVDQTPLTEVKSNNTEPQLEKHPKYEHHSSNSHERKYSSQQHGHYQKNHEHDEPPSSSPPNHSKQQEQQQSSKNYPCMPAVDPTRTDSGYLSYLKQVESYCKSIGRM